VSGARHPKRNLLTKMQIETLQALADGSRPKELGRDRTIWRRLQHMKLKMDAVHSWHLTAIAFRKGILR